MLNIALFGPPGAGKGTQSESLIREYNLFYISTGDLLREEQARNTALGLATKDICAAGGLVSDEIIVQIIESTIKENPHAQGFLFDGFPRTYIQAYILEGLMIKLNTSLTALINLKVPEELSASRLLARGQVSGRSDDNETVIRRRLSEYNKKTLPVLDFYREKGLLREVDATAPVEEVHDRITDIIQKELSKKLFNVVLFGYPGSGRGSQGRILAQRYGLEFVATEPMLEQEMQAGTPLGDRIRELSAGGQPIPDEIVVPLIERRLENSGNAKGFVFKDFPRTLVQSYILDGLLKKHGSSISMVLEIEVPTLELISRLDERSQTDRCMPYDNSTSMIVKRLKEHETKIAPVIQKYNQLHGVTKIDGTGTIEEVRVRVAEEIETGLRSMR